MAWHGWIQTAYKNESEFEMTYDKTKAEHTRKKKKNQYNVQCTSSNHNNKSPRGRTPAVFHCIQDLLWMVTILGPHELMTILSNINANNSKQMENRNHWAIWWISLCFPSWYRMSLAIQIDWFCYLQWEWQTVSHWYCPLRSARLYCNRTEPNWRVQSRKIHRIDSDLCRMTFIQ